MEVDGREVSLTYNGRTRDFLFRRLFNRSDVPTSCTSRDFSQYISRSNLVNRHNITIPSSKVTYLSLDRTFLHSPLGCTVFYQNGLDVPISCNEQKSIVFLHIAVNEVILRDHFDKISFHQSYVRIYLAMSKRFIDCTKKSIIGIQTMHNLGIRMSGILPNTGYTYQDLVGVLRTFSFITDPSLIYFEFESEGEALEDINAFYSDRVIYEQVKYKEHDDWRPHELQSIMDKFLRQKECDNCVFKFTTNTKGDSLLTKIDVLRKKLQQDDSYLPTDDDMQLLKRCFHDQVEDSNILWLIKRIDFIWNEFHPDPSDPIEKILEECKKQLMSLCGFSNEDAEATVLRLWKDVKRWSNKRYDRQYTISPFRKSVPDCGRFGAESLTALLPSETALTIMQSNPLRVIKSIRKVFDNISVNVPIILEYTKSTIHIWILRNGVMESEIQRINRIIDRNQSTNHLVIAIDERINSSSLSSQTRTVYVKWDDTKKLKNLLDAMKDASSRT